MDVIRQFHFDEETGVVTPCGVIRSGVKRAGRGLGPRYLIFAKALPTCYVVNELSSQVHSLSRPSYPGHLPATSRTPRGHDGRRAEVARRTRSTTFWCCGARRAEVPVVAALRRTKIGTH